MMVGRCRYEDLEQSPDEGAGWEVADPSTELMLGPVESHAETGKSYTNILTASVLTNLMGIMVILSMEQRTFWLKQWWPSKYHSARS